MQFNSKIQKLKATKLFASLEETFSSLERVVTQNEYNFATQEQRKYCRDRFKEGTHVVNQEFICVQNKGSNEKRKLGLNSIDQLLDSLLAVDIDYNKKVKKQDEETKKLKKQIENLQNSSDTEEELECKLVDNGGGKWGEEDSEGSKESGSKTIFTGLMDIISKAGIDSDIITGSWSSKRNKKGVIKTKFMLDDVPGAINLKGKTDSILGDSKNTRTVGSGNLKMDYYSDGKMIAEASVLEKYKEKIFDFKKMNGGFRINRENDTMTMCDGCNGDFSANTILNAQFEVNI